MAFVPFAKRTVKIVNAPKNVCAGQIVIARTAKVAFVNVGQTAHAKKTGAFVNVGAIVSVRKEGVTHSLSVI